MNKNEIKDNELSDVSGGKKYGEPLIVENSSTSNITSTPLGDATIGIKKIIPSSSKKKLVEIQE